MSCAHDKGIKAGVLLHRIAREGETETRAFAVEMTISCETCGLPFEFLGVPMGVNFSHPTTGVDHLRLLAPVTPQGVEPQKEHGLTEFTIRAKAGE